MFSAMRLRIGLTGGIGSGKSTVAQMLVERGAALIDTDAIARSMTRPHGAAIDPIRAVFGDSVLAPDGGLDRVRMREKAFADASVKNQLEAILHPLISAECSKQASTFAESIVVFDVPLLVESRKWRSQIDKVLVMDCDNDVQLHRVMQRPGWTRDSALAVIAQQAPRDIRVAAADAVIINHQLTLPQLADEVNALWARWAISR